MWIDTVLMDVNVRSFLQFFFVDLYSIIDEACWAVDLVSLSGQVTWGSPSNPNSARSKNLRSSPLFVRPP